jgi:hypothetical protein
MTFDAREKCGASNSIEANLISNTKLAKYEIIIIEVFFYYPSNIATHFQDCELIVL